MGETGLREAAFLAKGKEMADSQRDLSMAVTGEKAQLPRDLPSIGGQMGSPSTSVPSAEGRKMTILHWSLGSVPNAMAITNTARIIFIRTATLIDRGYYD